MAPNGTLITPEIAKKMVETGIERCSISIDGPNAETHDEFRGQKGAFDQAMRGIQYLKDAGLEFQLNTTVTRDNLPMFKDIFNLAQDLGAAAWHIFLLVPTGRAAQLGAQVISAKEYEDVLNWFYDFRKTTDMQMKATCAPPLSPHPAAAGQGGRRAGEFRHFRPGRRVQGMPWRGWVLLHLPHRAGPALRLSGS